MLNGVMAEDVRVLAWAPVDHGEGHHCTGKGECIVTYLTDFHARFDCMERSYGYFFVRSDLDILAMEAGARSYVGSHNFRNFCKVRRALRCLVD